MASRTEVAELDEQGKQPKEIAEALGISLNTVYAHLRAAGRARGGKRARRRTRVRAVAAAAALAAPPEAEPELQPFRIDQPGQEGFLAHIRAEIGDRAEHLESEMAVKRAEIEAMEAEHGPLMAALERLSAA